VQHNTTQHINLVDILVL